MRNKLCLLAIIGLILSFATFLYPKGTFADAYLDYSGFENELKRLVSPQDPDLIRLAEEFLEEIKYGEEIIEIDEKDWTLRMETLRKALSFVDLKALKNGEGKVFLESLRKAREILGPIEEVAKQYTIYLVSYSHIDMAWLWPRSETIQVMKNTSEVVLNFMDEYPDFIFSQSSAQAYRWMEEYYPQVFERIKERVKEGRWEIVGGQWVEPDCNLPSGESFIRQTLLGKRYFKDKFGVDVKIGWVPDSFGYNWNLPQILKGCGMEGFLTQKINWNDTTKFPHNIFWWQAPDGTKLLTYFPVGSYGEKIMPDEILNQLKRIKKNHNLRELLVIFGLGDHGGGITRDMLERAYKLRKTQIYPKIIFTSPEKFFERLKDSAKAGEIPVVNDELYLQYHRGTFTTQAKTKWNNRKGEVLLENVEKFSIIARKFGFIYPQEEINELWRLLGFNQFHDILSGSSIFSVYKDSAKDFKRIFSSGENILNEALKVISNNIDTEGEGKAIIIYNPLSWERSDLVEIEVENEEGQTPPAGLTPSGDEVQLQRSGLEKNKIIFIAERIPSYGYSTYRLLSKKSNLKPEDKIYVSNTLLENKFYKIKIDKLSGNISSIFDKEEKREILSNEGGNILQLFEDNPREYDAWNIGAGRIFKIDQVESIEVIEQGPVRGILRVVKRCGESEFQQDIIIYSNLKRIDFKIKTFWKLRHIMLKIAFYLNLDADFATYEIPYANIKRETNPQSKEEWAEWEVYGHKWIDYTQRDSSYGVSLLNDSKYGFDVKGNLIRMTLLRGPFYPDPQADKGWQSIFYSLYPHQGDWRKAKTIRRGYEVNYPLIIKFEENHKGSLPKSYSFFNISAENVVLSVVKKAEETSSTILRFFETEGSKTKVKIILPFEPREAYQTDFLERNLNKIKSKGNKISLPLGKYEIKTIKVEGLW